ncbi:MAG: hypothetical protein HRU29_14365 [Rhizobiales bacterium]|nr:hypothetical protein [Hyphomicrobiales bacterium]NRB15578.1 hypothetical protein [Hyphomicrobiales bacterium]
MNGILIQYVYNGDEEKWQAAIDEFIENIQSDKRLNGHFSYEVVCHEGGERAHIGHWDSAETLEHLQLQDFFKIFSKHVKEFAGDTLNPKRFYSKAKT